MDVNLTLNQLTMSNNGFNRLKVMTGANHFFKDSNSVGFQFKMCKKANALKITLNNMDTYDLLFYKIGKKINKEYASIGIKIYDITTKDIQNYENIYCDQLKEIFEQFTGLYLSL
jgi:hypothetical protein